MANRGPRNWWILIPAIVLAIFFAIVLIFRSDQARTTTTTVLLGVGIAGCIATALLEFLSPSGAGGGTDLGLSDLQLRRDDVAGDEAAPSFWGQVLGSKIVRRAAAVAIAGVIGAAGSVAAAAINHFKPSGPATATKTITCPELRASVRAHHDTKPYPRKSAVQKKCKINKTIAKNRPRHSGKR